MTLVRTVLGDQLRRRRQAQRRTLRDVSGRARVSLGYLSEIERGQKEPSSELLASICNALDVRVSTLLRDASEHLFVAETSSCEVPRERPMVMVRTVSPVGPTAPAELATVATQSVGGAVVVAESSRSAESTGSAAPVAAPVAMEIVGEIAQVAHLPVNVPVDRAA